MARENPPFWSIWLDDFSQGAKPLSHWPDIFQPQGQPKWLRRGSWALEASHLVGSNGVFGGYMFLGTHTHTHPWCWHIYLHLGDF
jgi:hypothetical protein